MQRIDVMSAPDQRVSAVLDGRRVTFRFRFNAWDSRWYFDLALDDLPVVRGRRIVTNRDLIQNVVMPGRLFAYVYGSAPAFDLWFVDGPAAEHFESLDGLIGRDLVPFGLYDGRRYHTGGGAQPGLTDFATGAAALFYVTESELAGALAAAA